MAVNVETDRGALDVRVAGMDRLWGLRSHIEVPLPRVRDARVEDAEKAKADLWIRTGGLGIPGYALVGHFRGRRARKQWWRVYRAPELVVIDLAPESLFDRIVLEVDDPEATVEQIRTACDLPPLD